jgi:mannose-1-phosphate guanylyltransferase
MSSHGGTAAPEAVIVAGGFGTRLLPLTTDRPKHLLEVGGVPFLEHQIGRLAAAGVQHVVVATSYHADLFEPVLGDGGRWGIAVEYVQEQEPLGTAGAIRNVAGSLGDDPQGAVVILNGDVLSGHDLGAQLAGFETPREGRAVDVSLHLVEVPDARAFGCVPTDATGRVTGFTEKSENPVTRQVNAGCYVFRRQVIDLIPPGRVVSVERETFPALVSDGALVVGHLETAYWRDVGTPAALVAASRDLVLGIAPQPDGSVWSGLGAWVDPAAVVDPGASVADGSAVSGAARVARGAQVLASVVMPGAVVGEGARLEASVLGPGAVVGAAVRLEGVTVGDGARISPGAHVAPGSRVECRAVVPAAT